MLPGCGTSFLALDLAVAVAAGVPCLRRFAADEPSPVQPNIPCGLRRMHTIHLASRVQQGAAVRNQAPPSSIRLARLRRSRSLRWFSLQAWPPKTPPIVPSHFHRRSTNLHVIRIATPGATSAKRTRNPNEYPKPVRESIFAAFSMSPVQSAPRANSPHTSSPEKPKRSMRQHRHLDPHLSISIHPRDTYEFVSTSVVH